MTDSSYKSKYTGVKIINPVHRLTQSGSDRAHFNAGYISGVEITNDAPNNGDILGYDSATNKVVYVDPSNFTGNSVLPRFSYTETSDVFEENNSGWSFIGGDEFFEVSIEPQYTNSKILFETIVNLSTNDNEDNNSSGGWYSIRLYRKIGNESFVHLTAASGTGGNPNVFMTDHLGFHNTHSKYSIINSKGVFLDSPNTTDVVTYKLKWQPSTNDGIYGSGPGKRILNTPGETSGSYPVPIVKSYMTATEVLDLQQ